MFRRAFMRALSMSAAATLPVTQRALARPLPQRDPPRNTRAVSLENPRIWPAATRPQPLAMGAVEAFAGPARAEEMRVQWQRIMFDWRALQARGPHGWSFLDDWLSPARAERDAGRPMIGAFIPTPG
jgi:hypothetical protein